MYTVTISNNELYNNNTSNFENQKVTFLRLYVNEKEIRKYF